MFYYQESPVEGEDATEFLWITDREMSDPSEVTSEDKSALKLVHPTGKPGIEALMEWMNKHNVNVEKH